MVGEMDFLDADQTKSHQRPGDSLPWFYDQPEPFIHFYSSIESLGLVNGQAAVHAADIAHFPGFRAGYRYRPPPPHHHRGNVLVP